ncbi:MAG: A/G-specific adenine glycosylase [Lysobacter sp.]|nr:A/G-specific adenine glycosylase [Lysobacter sp.]
MPARASSFASRVSAWQRRHGRHDLPWQGTRDPYRIWVSEIMLQQTQVATVIPYYERFITRFPDVGALASAPADEVMRLWSGLGYYARARNLHRAAQVVMERHSGGFPRTVDEAQALPGIGRSTASAIVAFSTGAPHAILDGNVKRVLARHFGIEGAADSAPVMRSLWALSESLVPARGIERYTQGLMDLGATVCTRSNPACERCPLRAGCVALRDGRVVELPGRKAARVARVKETAMLAIVSGDEVLVEKRPAAGIWGGLWSLPESHPDADPAERARAITGLRVDGVEALEPFRHAFTHFTLAVTPWLVRVRGRAARAGEPGTAWLALQESQEAALPAPVKVLLGRLARPAPSPRGSARAGTGAGSRGGRRGR